jgi:Cdc6-like AAA superfamily ATPase
MTRQITDKEKVAQLIDVWMKRADLKSAQAAAKAGLTYREFYNAYKALDRPLSTNPDHAISVVKAFTERLREGERCRADEAVQFLDLTSVPISRFSEIKNLFPEVEWEKAIRIFSSVHPTSDTPKTDWSRLENDLSTLKIEELLNQKVNSYATNILDFAIHYSESLWMGKYTPLDGIGIPTSIYGRSIVTHFRNQDQQGHFTSDERPIFDFINENKRLLILGHAGSGKTTVLLELLRREAEFILLNKTFRSIPIYISLTRLASHSNVFSLIHTSLNKYGMSINEQRLVEALQKGLFSILFDGLNEIPVDLRRDLGLRVLDFMDTYPTNHYYLTSRPYDFDFPVRKEMMSVVIQPLSLEGIQHFAQNYIGHIESKRFLEMTEITIEDQSQVDLSLIRILQTPLILLMSLEIFISTGEIHISKAAVFQAFFEMILSRERKLVRPNIFEAPVKKIFLTRLAFTMLDHDYILAADEEEIFLLVSNDKHISNLIPSNQLPEILEELSLNGFFRYDAFEIIYPRKIEWFHQRFQEYFAALRLVEKFKSKEDISSYLNKGSWKDIIVLAAEATDQKEAFLLEIFYGWRGLIGMIEGRNHRLILGIQVLMSNKTLYDKDFRENLLRDARAAMGTSFLRSLVINLENILSVFGFLTSLIGRSLLLMKKSERIQAVGIWLIGASGKQSLAKKLTIFLQDPRNRIRWMTAYALRMLGSIDTVDDLINALDDPDKDVRWRIVRALANINDQKSVKALVAVLDHEDPDTRAGAAYSLADLAEVEALPHLKEARRNPMNMAMLWWGETVVDVIDFAIQSIEKASNKQQLGEPFSDHH